MKYLLYNILILIVVSVLNPCQTYQVNNVIVNVSNTDEAETAIEINPNNPNQMMITWNDYGSSVVKPAYGFSTNGGGNWILGLVENPDPSQFTGGGDPSCIILNSNAFYTYVALNRQTGTYNTYCSRTTNYGNSWIQHFDLSPTIPAGWNDKPYMIYDFERDRIYVTWSVLGGGSYYILFTYGYINNNIWNWKTPRTLESGELNSNYIPQFILDENKFVFLHGAIPAIAPNGDLFVTWMEQDYADGTDRLKTIKSTDGGDNWATSVTISPNLDVARNIISGSLRCFTLPSVVITPTYDDSIYNIYCAFVQYIDEDLNIYFIKSTDQGASWSQPEIATEFTSGEQLFPWLTKTTSGNIQLIYYNYFNDLLDVYIAELFNNGNEFYKNDFKITTVSSDPYEIVSQITINDYLGGASNNKNVFPVWTDYRNGNADIFYGKYEPELRFAYENKSLDHTATSLNGQRKLAKDSNGNYHIVFSSNGEIFTRKSTNDGNSWQAPVRLSDGTGENKFPSITTMDNYLFITWQQYIGIEGGQHAYKIKGMYTSMTGWSPMTINDDEVYFSSPTDPLPVIVAAENIDNNYTSTDGLPEVMIAYSNPDGIYHINLFAWSPESLIYYYSQQGSDHKIPNTSTGYRNPSITVNGLGEIMLTCDYLGNIYAFLTTGGSWSAISSSIFQSAYIFSNTKSSITSDALNYFHISWQGENWVYQTNSILHKKISTSGGIGTPITEFRNNQYMSFQPSTFGHLDANGGVTLYWYTGDDLDIKKVINDGTRWDHSSTEFIPSIQTNARFVNSIDKDLPEDFAYCWTSAGDIPYDCNTCIGCEENQEDFGGSDSLKTFRRAEFSNSALDAILSLQLGNFQLKDINNNSYPLEPEELDANFTFQNFGDVLNVLFSDSIPRSNLYRKIAFEYEAVIKNLSKIKAINSNDVSLKLKLIDRTTGNTLYTSDAYTLPLDSIKRTIIGNLTIPFNRLNQRYDLSVKLILEGVAEEYLNQTENINLVNTYLSGSEYLGKQNETKNNTSKLTDYKLEQNYPNPFNPNTQIKYSVAEDGLVTIKVYDILGREIVVLVNEEKSTGNYEVEFNGSMLTSGIYFYQIKAGNFVETKKMILLK
jgi:hypothetical protein